VKNSGYNYIGRMPGCGCCVAVCADSGDKQTAKDVSSFITSGLYVELVSDADFRERVCKEPGFFKCPHQVPAAVGTQGKLF
jgi:hypothetical protein